MALLRKVAGFEDMLQSAAQCLGVHHVSHYLTELAGLLHSYYAKHQVLLADDAPRTLARLALLRCRWTGRAQRPGCARRQRAGKHVTSQDLFVTPGGRGSACPPGAYAPVEQINFENIHSQSLRHARYGV